MNFEKLPDNRGMIYVPHCFNCRKKNPCEDCFSCQWCGNERCRVCKGRRTKDQPGENEKEPGK